MTSDKGRTRGQPVFKWPGGKRAILDSLLPLLPSRFRCYYEPFVGGGALFFALQPTTAVLSDNNAELINCYVQIRDRPNEVIDQLAGLRNTAEDYYKIRGHVPADNIGRAVRFIYLVTLSFNGIHRMNLKGEFNVPYGRKTHLAPCDPARIRAASAVLASTEILCKDFDHLRERAGDGDLVYLDPPYTVSYGNNGFRKYNARIFSWNDQVRLAELAFELSRRGCKVIVSNADHPSIIELYRDFHMQLVDRVSRIAASREFRRRITERIFYNEV